MKKNVREARTPKPAAEEARAMNTMEIYAMVLTQLNQTVLRMTSADFDQRLQEGTLEDRQRAARELLDVQYARLALGNAVLSEIAEKLKANEQAFVDGKAHLDAALEGLEKIEAVLDTIGRFVKLVGCIVTLL
jgi:hypothetical protein